MTFNDILFMAGASLAAITTLMVIASRNPVYAVLYLIMSLFAVSIVFYTLGATFLAVLEVIVYAGAIMVLFLFVVMMLNLSGAKVSPDLERPSVGTLMVPGFFAVVLLLVVLTVLFADPSSGMAAPMLAPDKQGNMVPVDTMSQLGRVLYQKHYLGVELASLVLLIGIIGGMHLGRAAYLPDDSAEVKTSAGS